MQRVTWPDRLASRVLSAPEPPLQVGSIDDAEYQDHVVCFDDVVHHAVLAASQPVEGVVGAADGLDRLAGDASGAGDVMRESLECSADAITVSVTELLELPGRRARDLDSVGGQSRSSSLTVRRLA